MTKSQNTKDEQQKDLCITSEQQTEIKFPTLTKGEMSYSKKFLDSFKPENMKLRKIKFPKSLTKGENK